MGLRKGKVAKGQYQDFHQNIYPSLLSLFQRVGFSQSPGDQRTSHQQDQSDKLILRSTSRSSPPKRQVLNKHTVQIQTKEKVKKGSKRSKRVEHNIYVPEDSAIKVSRVIEPQSTISDMQSKEAGGVDPDWSLQQVSSLL